MGVTRVWGIAVLAVAIWWISGWTGEPHGSRGLDAPATEFSAARAYAALGRVLGPERPHPVSTEANAAVRERILKEFAAIGISARTYRAFTCSGGRGGSVVDCATVVDIIADIVPGRGKAIVLLAHYDSVPAGPGASDDQSGVVTVLETARALRARGGNALHPVIAVITDGEEAGLLGANAFLQNPSLKARVGTVVNVEARGTKGPSLLFQTSPGDGRLIDLYAAHAPKMATSSLYAEIYKYLPNDTDLTLFIRAGFPSFNFAFADNVRYYHSPRDVRANLSPETLQMHGDNMLGVVSGLEQTDYTALKGGDDVYLSLFGVLLPRLPAAWALPLAVIVFLALLVAVWLARGEPLRPRAVIAAALTPLALLIGCIVVGFILSWIAQLIAGTSDPSYAHPAWMRLSLALGVWAIALLVSGWISPRSAAAAGWLWLAGLGVITAALLPGLSPYFVFPSLVAAILLLAAALTPDGWNGVWGRAALLMGALGAFIVWFALVASGETLRGLALHPLFTVPAAFGLMAASPLLARENAARALPASAAITGALSLVAAVVAGLVPSYSVASPQRVNIIYFQDEQGAKWIAATAWKATATDRPPAALMRAAPFGFEEDAYGGLGLGDAYAASVGAPRFALPSASVLGVQRAGSKRFVSLRLTGSADTDAMGINLPKEAKLVAIGLRGQHVVIPDVGARDTRLFCLSRDCRDVEVNLTFEGAGPAELKFGEQRYGLPSFGDRLKSARPDTAMPSQSGDGVILVNTVKLPRS